MLRAAGVRPLQLCAQLGEAYLGVVEAAVEPRLLLLAVVALAGHPPVVAPVRPDLVAGQRALAFLKLVLSPARLDRVGARVRVVAPVDDLGVRAHYEDRAVSMEGLLRPWSRNWETERRCGG